jgi:hypothetical protein
MQKIVIHQITDLCDTYKQALRGLFVTGTSSDHLSLGEKVISQEQPTSLSFGGQREKVSDEPGLKTQIPWVLSCITLREKP